MIRSFRSRLFLLAALAGAAVCGAAGAARAQGDADMEPGFSVERLTPPPGPGVYFAAEGAEVLPHLHLSLGASASLMSRPLVLQHLYGGDDISTPVRTRLGFDFLAALGLGNHFQVGVAMPVVAAQDGDRLQGVDVDETALQPIALGDLRLHGKVRLVGEPGQAGGGVGATMTVSLPTGEEQHFAGERGTVIEWRLIGSWRWPGRGAVTANLGPRFRTKEVVMFSPARPHGNEIVGAVAGEVGAPWLPCDPVRALFEYTFVAGDQGPAGSVRGPSPEELRVGVRWRFPTGVSLTGGLGLGTSPDEVGSPAWRAFAAVRFDSAPAADFDRDGIPDHRDRCRAYAEDRDGFRDSDGCPDIDNDADGIPDRLDECPNESEDYDRHRDMDGCPDADPRLPRSPVPEFAPGT